MIPSVITLRLEFPDALTNALNALAAALAGGAFGKPATGAPMVGLPQAEPGGVPGHLDVSSLSNSPPVSKAPAAFLDKWTQERRDIIARDWPLGRSVHDIVDELNTLPGPPVDARITGIYACSSLQLKRPEGFKGARRAPPRGKQPLPPREPKPVALRTWSEERRAILRRDWPAGRPVGEIVDACNALPGLPVNTNRVGSEAGALGLRRPDGYLRNLLSQRQQQRTPALVQPAQIVAPQPIAERASLPAAVDGKIHATWAQIAAWAERFHMKFNGDITPIQKMAGMLGIKASIVLIEPFGPGSTASTLPQEHAHP